MAQEKQAVVLTPETGQKLEQTVEGLSKVVTAMAARLPNIPVANVERPLERENLTTIEEAKKYDGLMQREFVKIDSKGKPIDTKTLYRPVHIYPEFQSANPAEFIAVLVVEQYVYEPGPDGTPQRQLITSFNQKAREFHKEYKCTTMDITSSAD